MDKSHRFIPDFVSKEIEEIYEVQTTWFSHFRQIYGFLNRNKNDLDQESKNPKKKKQQDRFFVKLSLYLCM